MNITCNKTVKEPPCASFSRCQRFEQCQRWYYLTYVDKRYKDQAVKTSEAGDIGKAAHEVFAAYQAHRAKVDAMDLDWILAEAEKQANKYQLSEHGRSEVAFHARQFASMEPFDPQADAIVEGKYAINSDGHPVDFFARDAILRIVVDRMYLLEDGTAVIVDWKTGRSTWTDSKQLGLYGYVIKRLYPDHVKAVELNFVYTALKKTVTFAVSDEECDAAARWAFDTMKAVTKERQWLPSPGKHCDWCEYAHLCNACQTMPLVTPSDLVKARTAAEAVKKACDKKIRELLKADPSQAIEADGVYAVIERDSDRYTNVDMIKFIELFMADEDIEDEVTAWREAVNRGFVVCDSSSKSQFTKEYLSTPFGRAEIAKIADVKPGSVRLKFKKGRPGLEQQETKQLPDTTAEQLSNDDRKAIRKANRNRIREIIRAMGYRTTKEAQHAVCYHILGERYLKYLSISKADDKKLEAIVQFLSGRLANSDNIDDLIAIWREAFRKATE